MASTSRKPGSSESESSEEGGMVNSSAQYVDNPDWADVQPIYNSIAEDAVVRINHSAQCECGQRRREGLVVDAFAYFRAIIHKNELSDRAFELTTTCTQLNPANYSVW